MANSGPDFLGATNTTISVGSQDAISEEEKALQQELENCKASLEEARKAVADTDFYEMTEHVLVLGRIKFKVRKHLRGHLAKVTCIQWGSDNQLLLSASQDGKLIVWDTFTSKKIHMIPLKTAWVMGCAFSPSLNFVASGGLDNIISLFCLKSVNNVAKHVRDLTGHSGYVGCLRFMDDQHLLSSSGDKTCAYWDVETASIISSYRGHANDVTAIAVSKQTPNTFVSSSSDHTCRLWDLRSSEAVQYFEGHQQDVNGVDFFPANAYAFASSSDDGSCRLWDIRGDQAIGVYIDDFITCGCSSVAISKSGRLLISGYDDFNCHVWDLLREERVGILSAHENRVCSVTISESGIGVATGSWDTTCLIWTAK
ncbi:guanine nucleotide-binding protein G(I)/G(S)/G(T) subunit beta-1 [Paragonimus westermani]|uniref:Guanine nucleotide-binding protein G(I)/G(S)/G(T) subunit beta-1 n=1 Tax=Paragonimus westermani TaxID=34504 RepID=A0A5J4P3I3_9TREM|nr:guanine nucleotide-binding protein G(I)/G(S)/G(T) subunit beta-1 [Paragonimus westermani]